MTPEELKQSYCDWEGIDRKRLDWNSFSQDCFDAFCAGHAAAQPKWVKISDYLPPSGTSCYVVNTVGDVFESYFAFGEFVYPGDYTHWQPMTPPAPPEQK